MNKKGNILVTFILLVGISAVLLSFIYLVTARISDTASYKNRTRAFYIAEAGLSKALWYLMTPVGDGGYGSTWRTGGVTESFGGGQYTISVADKDASTLTIVSAGEINGTTKTLTQDLAKGSSSSSFTNAVYGDGNMSLSGHSTINGPVFTDGNITLTGSSSIDGAVSLPPGHTISGGSATVVSPNPPAPSLETSYYDSRIADAMAVPAGNMSISSTYNLGGGTLYVHGNLSVSSGITGGGTIVVTGTFSKSGSYNVDSNTTIISNGNMYISGSGNISSGAVLYSANDIYISGGGDITGSILSLKGIAASGNGRIIGVVYSGTGLTGETEITGNRSIIGSIISRGPSAFSGNVDIIFDPTKIPSSIPGIVGGSSPMSKVKGTWKEL
jgi:cytoskeletal protein CcmA (bactofilin family)